MSEQLQLSHHGHGENEEDCDVHTTKHGHDENDEESDIPSTRQRQNSGINEIVEDTIKKSEAQDTSAISDIIGMVDTYDRPVSVTTEGSYSNRKSSVTSFGDKPGKRIPKAKYIAEAGYGRATFTASILEAEARGPNASASAEASLLKVGAMGRAEIASASAKAGPFSAKVGLGLDTGASIGVDGVEVKFLGTGISIGSKIGVSVLGSEAACSVM